LSVSHLIEESSAQLKAEWEILGKSFSSRVANGSLTQVAVQPVLEALHQLCAIGPQLPETILIPSEQSLAESAVACQTEPSEEDALRKKVETISRLKDDLSMQLTRLQEDLQHQHAEKRRCEEQCMQEKYTVLEVDIYADNSAESSGNKDAESYPLTNSFIWSDEVKPYENDIKRVYRQHLQKLEFDLTQAHYQITEMSYEARKVQRILEQVQQEKTRLRREVEKMDKYKELAVEEMSEIKEKYDKQISVLSEHLCTLADNLSVKDANLAQVNAGVVCCGRCGSWNKIGSVLASGACQYCEDELMRIDGGSCTS